jgi:hypothetical protein
MLDTRFDMLTHLVDDAMHIHAYTYTYTGLRLFVEMLEKDSRRSEFPLVVTHVTRNDIILGFLAHAQKLKQDGQPFGGALVCSYILLYF